MSTPASPTPLPQHPEGPGPRPGAARSGGMSTGALLGLGIASIVILTVGVGGPIAGYLWGESVGQAGTVASIDAEGCGSGSLCDDRPQGAPAATPSDSAASESPSPLGFRGDWTLEQNAPFQGEPELRAYMPKGWEIVPSSQPHTDQYRSTATGCVFIVTHVEEIPSEPGVTDAAVSGGIVRGWVGAAAKDARYSSSTPSALTPMWIDVNGGTGRVQFINERVDNTLAKTGAHWTTFLVARAFSQPSTLVLASLLCPAQAHVDESSPVAHQAFGALDVSGW